MVNTTGSTGDDNIDGSGGNDSILGADGNDTIRGYEGQDTLRGENGNDSISGGSDDDLITGDAGDDTLSGDDGNDLMYGDTGADSIDGGAGNDTIYGWFGNDTIRGGEGNDTIGGDQDDDSIMGDGGDDLIDGGDGNDYVDGGTGADSISGGAGTDTLSGGEGNDYIDGGSGDDTIEGGSGDDTVVGGDGNDWIDDEDGPGNGQGNDNFSGGAGDDFIWGGEGNDTLSGDEGSDFIEGEEGNDLISGGADDDTLLGGTGDDTIDGGTGNDELTGGEGNDVFVVSPGSDTITDFNSGNTGTLNDGDSTNNDFIDLSAYYDHIAELHADQADNGKLDQSNTAGANAVDYSNNTRFAPGDGITFKTASADNSSFTNENTGVVCFASGTMIRTPRGDVEIETLRAGDLVTTMDNGPQPIVWMGKRHVAHEELASCVRLRPVLIKEGVLGAERDLLVSRQHGILLEGTHFARAVHLTNSVAGVCIATGKRKVCYVHLMFAAHQIIFAQGVASESFYPGPIAYRTLCDHSRAELDALFPNLSGINHPDVIHSQYGPTARPFLANRKAVRALLDANERHVAHPAARIGCDAQVSMM